jgi:hypothetical protein
MLVKFTEDTTLTKFDLRGNAVGEVEVKADEEMEVPQVDAYGDDVKTLGLTFPETEFAAGYQFINLSTDLVLVEGE